MSILQSFLPYSNATVSNYTTWAQGFGTALSAFGWVKQSDAAGVTWANVTALANVPQYGTPFGTILYAGAWAAATATYTAGSGATTTPITGQSTFSIVTDLGLTYACILAPYNIGGTTGIQALQNSNATLTITAVTATTVNTSTTYTVSSGVTSSMIGQQFVVTVGGSNLSGNNAGTFLCITTSGTTSITLGNPNGTTVGQGTITGGSPGAQAISSTSVLSFIILNNNVPLFGVTFSNALVGHSVNVAGFTGGGTANNGNYTITANASVTDISNNGAFAATATGTNATQVSPAATISENTHPASDPYHWMPYNYEIWKTNGSQSTTAPIYLKLVYCTCSTQQFGTTAEVVFTQPGLIIDVGTQYPSVGQISGNHLTELPLGFVGSSTGVGNTYECDFSGNSDEFAFILWRNSIGTSTSIPIVLYIDRTKDENGNTLSTFFTLGSTSQNTARFQYTIFNSGSGSVINYQPAGFGSNVSGWTIPIAGPTGLAYQGLTPVLPIFPLPGYVANPVLMAVAMKTGDFTDGQLVNAVLYGTSHTFLMSKSQVVDQPQLGAAYPGIRWE